MEWSREGTLYNLESILKLNSWAFEEIVDLWVRRKDLDHSYEEIERLSSRSQLV